MQMDVPLLQLLLLRLSQTMLRQLLLLRLSAAGVAQIAQQRVCRLV